MFDIGWNELLVIGVVALFVIGPKDLPFALRTVGRWVGKARMLAREFQGHVDDMIREAELEEIRKKATEAADAVNIRRHIENTVDPTGSIRDAFTPPSLTGSEAMPKPSVAAPGPVVASAPASIPTALAVGEPAVRGLEDAAGPALPDVAGKPGGA
ncbi:MAG TPA: Sec-independent protein translocase protein TatB [Azospirillaceae bacterium]|nr:Sec-independent protein translocase protein TatB [Azospirillaceae bacterium]